MGHNTLITHSRTPYHTQKFGPLMSVTKRVWRLSGASFLNPNGRVRVKEPNPHGRNQTSKVRPVLGDKVFLPCSLQFVTLGPCNLQGLFWNHTFCAITDSLLVKLRFVYKNGSNLWDSLLLGRYIELHKINSRTLAGKPQENIQPNASCFSIIWFVHWSSSFI